MLERWLRHALSLWIIHSQFNAPAAWISFLHDGKFTVSDLEVTNNNGVHREEWPVTGHSIVA